MDKIVLSNKAMERLDELHKSFDVHSYSIWMNRKLLSKVDYLN